MSTIGCCSFLGVFLIFPAWFILVFCFKIDFLLFEDFASSLFKNIFLIIKTLKISH